MRFTPQSPYWAIVGLDLAIVAAASITLVWRLQKAFESEALTRDTLARLLLTGLLLMGLLLIAGWAHASRPRRRYPQDALWD